MVTVYQRSSQMEITTAMRAIDCASCGLLFGITADFEQRRRDDGQEFYCPAGHINLWTASELDKLRGKLQQQEREVLRQRARADQLAAARDAEERSHRATKGKLTKFKNKIARGLCPHCDRYFPDLLAHVDEIHPGEADEPEEAGQ